MYMHIWTSEVILGKSQSHELFLCLLKNNGSGKVIEVGDEISRLVLCVAQKQMMKPSYVMFHFFTFTCVANVSPFLHCFFLDYVSAFLSFFLCTLLLEHNVLFLPQKHGMNGVEALWLVLTSCQSHNFTHLKITCPVLRCVCLWGSCKLCLQSFLAVITNSYT